MKAYLLIALACFAAAGCKKVRDDSSAAPGGGPFDVRPGAGPGVMGVRGAINREELEHALGQIRIFIESASSVDGHMPEAQVTYEAIKKEAPKYAKFIDDGLIILNIAKTRDEVWAYAVLPQGNFAVLTVQGIERKSQQELNAMLGR
ncbi:MAG TPA: hypothetical protein VKE40_05255 [Gemmataceae bacterium]|nr:hypothetical protein [Gemmataceae bacterium]